ncbi:MAG: hypothetical protein CMO07_12320 [Thalassospira sp.]|jgi:hypothetical protein|nr:hypothetical protein AUQ41_01660 [Thalassospira sp. MCCC 1A02898]MBE71478.1 hypothetical protein [Thalassospira sp.]ONH89440.1 hypothetical protein TH47_05065 [Thalassospira sp. MCCC 1A02803]HAI32288.1 hypothetical protein [Thalassospira sp.]|tara:strand:- start:3145 stop:4233 length:1089 start_codon:yes stop_codon:yes gene_type:complete
MSILLQDGDLDIVRAALRSGTRTGTIRKSRLWVLLEERLPERFDTPMIIESLRELQALGELRGVFSHGMRPLRNVQLDLKREDIPAEYARWQEVIAKYQDKLNVPQKAALQRVSSSVLELSEADQISILEGLIAIFNDKGVSHRDPYITSAKHLLGSSKALDTLGAPVAEAFGVAKDAGYNRVQYVLTAGPRLEDADAIVFIENMAAFTAFSQSPSKRSIIGICSFGYGISLENLGERLLMGKVVSCPVDNTRQELSTLIKSDKTKLFWGDLDREALRIFEKLRYRIPELRLSAAYGYMIEEFERRGGHPYGAFSGKSGQQRTASDASDKLRLIMDLVRSRAFDQEAVCDPWLGDIVGDVWE